MMTRLLTVQNVQDIIQAVGIEHCLIELVDGLRHDFSLWQAFGKMTRVATHFPHGVIELMPIHDETLYAYKYVNGHPFNPQQSKLTVVAVGMLAEIETGYPLLVSEMTLLTALRTAATCALASQYLARQGVSKMAIIGTGSQAEFQVLALAAVLPINAVYYFDIDRYAMEKFSNNLAPFDFDLVACNQVQSMVADVDIIVTATADKQQARILENDWITPGVHINGVGGDCSGKTELDPAILDRAKVVVEYLEQSKLEGEIQHLDNHPYAELWEIITAKKIGRESDDEITVFDSVGFALEDYTVLKYFYSLAEQMNIGEIINLIPKGGDPKDLFALIKER